MRNKIKATPAQTAVNPAAVLPKASTDACFSPWSWGYTVAGTQRGRIRALPLLDKTIRN
jgi:hypothetical protein